MLGLLGAADSFGAVTIFTWSGAGADSNWSTPGNWVGGVAPTGVGGVHDILLFPASATSFTATDDFTGASNSFDGNQEIYVMNADGTNQTRITNNPASDQRPQFSPDGTRIAFESNRGGPTLQIFVMNADGTNVQRLTNDSFTDFEPNWSPDGTQIVFASNRDGNFEIYVMQANGAAPSRLTVNNVVDQLPAFTPDGSRIVFTSAGSDGNNHLFAMDPNGANVTQLTTAADANPAPGPNGRKIAFTSIRDGGDNEIYVMNADGTGQRRITSSAGIDTAPAWQPVFPPQTVGIYRFATQQWFLRDSNSNGPTDTTFAFGQPGDVPVTGDWNGDGQTDFGVFQNGSWTIGFLRTVTILGRSVNVIADQTQISFGQAGDIPITGDWDGDGVDDLGLFRPGTKGANGQMLLRVPQTTVIHPCSFCPPITITTFTIFTHDFGIAGDLPVAGDWDQDGVDGVGVFIPGSGDFLLSNDGAELDFDFAFGANGDQPLAGNWTGTGTDSVGVFRVGQFRLATVLGGPADVIFNFGGVGDRGVVGHWEPVEP